MKCIHTACIFVYFESNTMIKAFDNIMKWQIIIAVARKNGLKIFQAIELKIHYWFVLLLFSFKFYMKYRDAHDIYIAFTWYMRIEKY